MAALVAAVLLPILAVIIGLTVGPAALIGAPVVVVFTPLLFGVVVPVGVAFLGSLFPGRLLVALLLLGFVPVVPAVGPLLRLRLAGRRLRACPGAGEPITPTAVPV